MVRKSSAVIIIVVATVLALVLNCYAEDFILITDDEARMPTGDLPPKGLIPGPIIQIISPSADATVRSPIRFVVRFTTFARTLIDFDTLRLVYVKKDPVDLTARIKAHIEFSGERFNIDNAVVPPGYHTILIEVRDTDRRFASTSVTFKVAP